ncbi:hypothetical protein GGF46_003845 [Coemansia sp. RSA 552]|nr:hypothetical protein GGF46_003845 [Coemansia sp. RSA 552]
MDLSKYTHINMAFGLPTAEGNFTFSGKEWLDDAVKEIQENNSMVLMSIGGWSGSAHFSGILKDTTARNAFINNMVSYVQQHNLDGIDIDWEFPGRQGDTGNPIDEANDTPNFLCFLQELRSRFNSEFGARKKLITMAVRIQPFDIDGKPTTDVAEFADYVDFANIMQYDVNGSWGETTGPNAPLEFECNRGNQQSFASAIEDWTNAGWPADKLTAGLAFYGHAMTAVKDMTQEPSNQYQPITKTVPQGDKEDKPEDGAPYSGSWQWKHLRDQGLLCTPTEAAEPWTRHWDNVTKTPWLFNSESKVYISYDDPQSIREKAAFAKKKGLAGVMVWSIENDYQDELLDAALAVGKCALSTS